MPEQRWAAVRFHFEEEGMARERQRMAAYAALERPTRCLSMRFFRMLRSSMSGVRATTPSTRSNTPSWAISSTEYGDSLVIIGSHHSVSVIPCSYSSRSMFEHARYDVAEETNVCSRSISRPITSKPRTPASSRGRRSTVVLNRNRPDKRAVPTRPLRFIMNWPTLGCIRSNG